MVSFTYPKRKGIFYDGKENQRLTRPDIEGKIIIITIIKRDLIEGLDVALFGRLMGPEVVKIKSTAGLLLKKRHLLLSIGHLTHVVKRTARTSQKGPLIHQLLNHHPYNIYVYMYVYTYRYIHSHSSKKRYIHSLVLGYSTVNTKKMLLKTSSLMIND